VLTTAKAHSIDILSIQETAIPGTGKRKLAGGYWLHWSGAPAPANQNHAGVPHTGVALLLSPTAAAALIEWETVSPRMMLASFSCAVTVTILAFYAPHSSRPAAERRNFRSEMQRVRGAVNRHKLLILLGDANAKVGTKQDGPTGGAVGPHGVPGRNDAGQALLDDCAAEQLCVANTFFQHKLAHKAMCRTPDPVQIPGEEVRWRLHSNDVVIVRRSFLSSVRDVRAFGAPSTGFSDHRLVIARLRLKLHGIRKRAQAADVGALARDPGIKALFQAAVAAELANKETELTAADAASSWAIITAAILSSTNVLPNLAKHHAHLPTTSQRLLQLLAERTAIARRIPTTRTRSSAPLTLELQRTRNAIRGEVRRLKRERLDELCTEMDRAAALGDQGMVWRILQQITPGRGPAEGGCTRRVAASDVTLKATDGTLIVGKEKQLAHLREHHMALSSTGYGAEPDAVDQLGPHPEAAQAPPLSEVETVLAMGKLKNGKAPAPNGMRNEHLKYGGPELAAVVHKVLCEVWEQGLPAACKEADLVSVPKKGDIAYADNRRAVQINDKLYMLTSKILGDRLTLDNDERISELQAGFRFQRGCRDQRCSLQLLMDEALERGKTLYVSMVDLEKAFDRVPRAELLEVMRHYGVEPEHVRIADDLHTGTTARIKWRGGRSEPFPVTWGVQQGSPASNPEWNLYVNIIVDQMLSALGAESGVEIYWLTNGQLHRPSEPPNSAERLRQLLLLLADDIIITAPTAAALRRALVELQTMTRRWGMRISAKKTKVMVVQRDTAPDVADPDITIEGEKLEVVKHGKYLGSTFSSNGTMEREITLRLTAASGAAARLRKGVWRSRRVGLRTKLRLYNAAVLTVLLYGGESWALTTALVQRLETFHQQCLRQILGTRYWQHISNVDICARAGILPIRAILSQRRLLWLGEIGRMDSGRLVKRLLFSQQGGTRPRAPPRTGLRRVFQRDVRALHGGHPNGQSWYSQCQDTKEWRELVLAADLT